MKVLKKTIKECEKMDWKKINVLDLKYSHKGFIGRVLIQDYDDINYKDILKRLRVEIRNTYNKKIESA